MKENARTEEIPGAYHKNLSDINVSMNKIKEHHVCSVRWIHEKDKLLKKIN